MSVKEMASFSCYLALFGCEVASLDLVTAISSIGQRIGYNSTEPCVLRRLIQPSVREATDSSKQNKGRAFCCAVDNAPFSIGNVKIVLLNILFSQSLE